MATTEEFEKTWQDGDEAKPAPTESERLAAERQAGETKQGEEFAAGFDAQEGQ